MGFEPTTLKGKWFDQTHPATEAPHISDMIETWILRTRKPVYDGNRFIVCLGRYKYTKLHSTFTLCAETVIKTSNYILMEQRQLKFLNLDFLMRTNVGYVNWSFPKSCKHVTLCLKTWRFPEILQTCYLMSQHLKIFLNPANMLPYLHVSHLKIFRNPPNIWPYLLWLKTFCTPPNILLLEISVNSSILPSSLSARIKFL